MSSRTEETGTFRHSAEELAAGYDLRFRAVEIGGIALYLTLSCVVLFKLREGADQVNGVLWLSIAAAFIGWLAVDFVSGLGHWAGDTWGTPDWPIVGPTLIRTFREHHLDEKMITRHDFVETNGTNSLLTIPFYACALLLPVEGPWSFLAVASLGSLNLWGFATNQIHKWAHQDKVPALARLLQKWRVILSPEHHALHHRAPFSSYYCITHGWLNPVLQSFGFFRRSEALIAALTGAVPRENDVAGPGA